MYYKVCIFRCIKLSLVHDMAECIVGDITPDQLDKDEKHRREKVRKNLETVICKYRYVYDMRGNISMRR